MTAPFDFAQGKTRIVGIILLAIVAAARAHAAADPATLPGIAVDAQGLPLPGVTVTVTPAGASQSEPLVQVTDGEGRFVFDGLAPGTYTVVVSLAGFDDQKFDAVTVPAADELKAVLQLAGFNESITVRPPEAIALPSSPVGEAVVPQQTLTNVPLATERFEDALPLLPGIVRGPDGLLNMNGARADQSAVLLNGVNMTDPVTGHSAVRLPLEAIESLNVHGGVYSAAFGSATGGITDIVTRAGGDTLDFQVQNVIPRLRFVDGGAHGIDSFTPRMRVSGAIEPGRFWFSQAASYRFVRSRVDELEPLDASEQKVTSFDTITQLDYAVSPAQRVTGTLIVFPSNIDNVGIDTLHPFDATPDLKQRGWIAAAGDRAVLGDNMTLSTAFAVKQFNMAVNPKYGDTDSFVTVFGGRNNYFNRFDRDSRRYDASATLAIARPTSLGDHTVKAGGQFAHTSYDGIDASQRIVIQRADGTRLRQIDHVGDPAVAATNTDVAGFIEDEWALGARVTLHGGVRYGYERIAGEQTLSPRVDASIRPFDNGRTVVKGGIGHFYDKLPLNAADVASHQARLITDYDRFGNATTATFIANRIDAEGLRTPASTAWNVEIDQMIAPKLLARVGYRQSRATDQLIVDNDPAGGALVMSSTGRARSREFELTVRRQFANAGHVTASYVRSRTEGDLNDFVSLFGDLRDPIVRDNEYSRQSFDTPNRLLVWGLVNLPNDISVAPTVEYRNGFPYSIVDQTQTIVGTRNLGGRFPEFFTLDLAVTKDVQITRGRRARVGVQLFNLTDHFNPRDVQNNIDSPSFGAFANSVDRQVRAKFVFLF